jgi:hypothetical protein
MGPRHQPSQLVRSRSAVLTKMMNVLVGIQAKYSRVPQSRQLVANLGKVGMILEQRFESLDCVLPATGLGENHSSPNLQESSFVREKNRRRIEHANGTIRKLESDSGSSG